MLTHFPQAVPEIPVNNVDKAAEYYVSVLGFSFDWGNDDGGIGGISQGDCRMFLTNAPFRAVHGPKGPVIVWLNLNSKQEVDELFERWKDAGAKIVEAVEDKPWNLREFRVADLDGNQLRVFYDFNWEMRRPVSNDNPFSEAHFKTLKYCPRFRERFGSIEDGRSFGQDFFRWYNHEHCHSGLGFLTPAVVHGGQAATVRDHRRHVLTAAYLAHPERFVKGRPRPADLPQAVWINPPAKNTTAQDATGTTIVISDDCRSTQFPTRTTLPPIRDDPNEDPGL